MDAFAAFTSSPCSLAEPARVETTRVPIHLTTNSLPDVTRFDHLRALWNVIPSGYFHRTPHKLILFLIVI